MLVVFCWFGEHMAEQHTHMSFARTKVGHSMFSRTLVILSGETALGQEGNVQGKSKG